MPARAGSYMAEITARRGQQELGRDVVTLRRENGVAENFHVEQNRELLEKLSSETGGRYYRPSEADQVGRRHLLFRCRHHRARDQRSVGHADRIFPGIAVVLHRMAAAPPLGSGMSKIAKFVGRPPWSARVPQDPPLYQQKQANEGVGRGPGGPPHGVMIVIGSLPWRQSPASTFYVTVAGLGGEPEYEQRFASASPGNRQTDPRRKSGRQGANPVRSTGHQSPSAERAGGHRERREAQPTHSC